MSSWLRPVMPPTWTVALFVVLYVAFEGLIVFLEFRLGGRLDIPARSGSILLAAACLSFGAFRAVAFHPFFQPRYRNWLKAVPWTGAKPLPLGPVHFVWQDVVILAALGVLGWLQRGFHPLWVVSWVMAGWLPLVGLTLRPSGAWGFNYAVWFGLGLMLWLARQPVAYAAAAVVTYLAAWFGLRHSLARFPWEGVADDSPVNHLLTRRDQTPIILGAWFGWPFDHLGPKFPPYWKISLADAALTGLLMGWWLYAIGSQIPPGERATTLSGLHSLGLFGLTVGRVVLYCGGYWPPMSLLGRLRLGRWIIPGYDKVFLAPLGVLAVALLAPELVTWSGLAAEYGLPMTFALGVFLTLGAGPGLIAWRLTGNHRIVSGMLVSNPQTFLKVG